LQAVILLFAIYHFLMYPYSMAYFKASSRTGPLLIRAARFLYLLWGGMLLMRLASMGQMRFPAWIWDWPKLASKLTSPIGRGALLGLGLAMALAALLEIWELVDMVLLKIMREKEHRS